ncbi:MAG: sulfatase-like hydrolase/transferase [Pirellulaceae bacterium]|nr:sulfatase-like hydrolase/transferase [Pirellulaceae bacterium]
MRSFTHVFSIDYLMAAGSLPWWLFSCLSGWTPNSRNGFVPQRVKNWPGLCAFAWLCLSCGWLAAEKPNIIIILSDDHGYTDLGAYGIDANVQTPAMDKLAANGALMRYGYSTAPQCVPSRAGLMSGRVQNTFGLRGNGDSDEPIPKDVPTLAERIKAVGGYRTGFVGKWHLGSGDNAPGQRGFDDFVDGPMSRYTANYDLSGKAMPTTSYTITGNRVEHQGKAAAAFIEKNHAQPFFLYVGLYGPHLPRIKKDDPYYLNFPAIHYQNSTAELDDIRRQGLALVKAIDDAVDRMMVKLREHQLEDKTIIFFAGDNGAQPKYFTTLKGRETLSKWDGSENVPLRGEKGSLWEGGMKVPMWVYAKGRIAAGQTITQSVSTLDFTATALKLAGGELTPELDGVDLLPLLTKKSSNLARKKDLFWDWGDGIALQRDGWKIHRFGKRFALFQIQNDPNEFFDLQHQQPEKFKELQSALMERYNSLPEQGRSPLRAIGRGVQEEVYVVGAPETALADPRYLYPYDNGKPVAYPAPLRH